MADAVDKLVASTGQKDAASPAAEPPKTTIPVSVAGDNAAAPAPEADQAQAQDKAAGTDDSSGGGSKKVIKPLDSKPKKDIKELLAEEEAKENQTIPGATVSAVGSDSDSKEDRPSGAPMPPPGEAGGSDGVDPNTIAL
jgi:hypothetical protein